jgi:HSP20 family protein
MSSWWIRDWFGFEEEELERPSWDAQDRCLEPLVEIQEREDEVIVTIDLPCVESKEDISLDVTEDTLYLEARFSRSLRWEIWGTIQRRIEFTSFRKAIRLPAKVKPDDAKAEFKSSVLRVVLPKAVKKVKIKVE